MTNHAFNSARRKFLQVFGLGTAATAVGVVLGSDSLFAKQFAADVDVTKLPRMLYDPELQMMVDPATRRPLYLDSQKLATLNAKVTAGCKDCPKCDDNCG